MRCRCCGCSDISPGPQSDAGRYYRCGFCGSLSADWEYPQEIYDETYVATNLRFLGGNRSRLLAEMRNHVRIFADMIPEKGDFLDVGCLDGAGMEAMQADAWNVWGSDVIPATAEFIERETGIPRDRVFLGETIGRQFDAVMCRETIEHVQRPLQFLKSTISLAKPGGIVQIQTPRESDDPGFWNQRAHLQIFTPRWLRLLIENCDCVIVDKHSWQWEGGQIWTCRRQNN